MFLHFHLSRIIRDIEKIRAQTPKKDIFLKNGFQL